MTQTRQSEKSARPSAEHPVPVSSSRLGDRAKRLDEAIDRLVDEIDDVLEKNAEEFVKNYVQRGGE